jgi:hypothetical protein
VKLNGERESRNFVDITPLQTALLGPSMPDGPYNRNHIILSDHEQDMYNRGMTLPDIMYIRAIKAKILKDQSFSMIPDNTNDKPYR